MFGSGIWAMGNPLKDRWANENEVVQLQIYTENFNEKYKVNTVVADERDDVQLQV